MWLRVGKRSRWPSVGCASNPSIDKVAQDLKPRDGERLSVYKVESEAEAEFVAAAFAVTQRAKEDIIDYVILPDDMFDSCPEKTSCQLPNYLDIRHYEVGGLDDSAVLTATSQRAHQLACNGSATRFRLKESDICRLFLELEEQEPSIRDAAQWPISRLK